MKKIIEKHKNIWKNKEFKDSVLLGLILLVFSLVVNYFAGNYANGKESNPVTDIILDNIPTFDVGFIFIQGSLLLFLFIFFLLIQEPKRTPFTLKSLSLFILIRSLFISLTHIGPFPQQIPLDPNRILEKITFGGDLFFSGHTGIPFLMALIFWQNKNLRSIFLAISVIFGASVLMGHLHYSIDVFAAFFITFTIFHIAQKFFKKDYEIIVNDVET